MSARFLDIIINVSGNIKDELLFMSSHFVFPDQPVI